MCHGLQLVVALGIYFLNLYYLSNNFLFIEMELSYFLAIFTMEKEILKVFIKEGGSGYG
jgi:hypothetical protein